jgi:hypothetical protein
VEFSVDFSFSFPLSTPAHPPNHNKHATVAAATPPTTMSQQHTLGFIPQSRSSSTHLPNLDGTGATPSTKRTRNDEPDCETTAPSGGASDRVITEINDKQNSNFDLMDTNLKRYFKDAIHEITTLIQQQHDRQLLGLQNEIASLRTAVNRLERAHLPNNTLQQPTNKQTTTTNNITQSTQQDWGRSSACTPNPKRQPSQRQPSQRRNRGASAAGRRVTYANTASQLPPADTPTTPATPPRKKTVSKLISANYPKAEHEIIVAFKDPMTVPANEAI